MERPLNPVVIVAGIINLDRFLSLIQGPLNVFPSGSIVRNSFIVKEVDPIFLWIIHLVIHA